MKHLVFIGDTHRKWIEFRETVAKHDLKDCAIIHLGDGGFGLTENRKVELEVLKENNEWLKKRNCIMYNIRGNHDNPYWFMGEEKLLAFLQREDAKVPGKKDDFYYVLAYVNRHEFAETVMNFTNIKFVQDYTVLNEGGHNILCIGGAISVDRTYQATKDRYFKKEKLKYNPIVKELGDIDIVATHTAPDFIYQDKGTIVDTYKEHDKTLVRDLANERKLMAKIYKDIVVNNKNVQYFMYGHFHRYYNEIYENTKFICLPPNQLFFIR